MADTGQDQPPTTDKGESGALQQATGWWKRQSKTVKIVIVVAILAIIGAIIGAAQGGGDDVKQSAVATVTTAEPTTTLPPTTTTTESEADFKARCEAIAYKVLNKNPDSLAGNAYYFKGKVFQIQEDSGETFMLIEVTKGSYGIWDDNVAVYYPGVVDVYEDDIVEVWGTCTGSFSYTSVAGYELTVPSLMARYAQKSY